MARNVLKYERLLAENAHQAVAETVIQRPNVPHLQTRDTYEGLCQTLGSQVGLLRERERGGLAGVGIVCGENGCLETIQLTKQPLSDSIFSYPQIPIFEPWLPGALTLLFLHQLYSSLLAHTLPTPQPPLLL